MRVLFVAISFLLIAGQVRGSEGEFAVSKIPSALLKNANAVLRLEEENFQVINRSKAVHKKRWVITILNEKGNDWTECVEVYTRFEKIISIEGVLYDASGKSIRKMKTKEAEDISALDESSLIDDYRLRRHNFYHRVYPYTIEYEVETELYSTLFFPEWVPLSDELISVERSSFTLTCPIDYEFRFKAVNYKDEPQRSQKDKTKSATWTVTNMPAVLKEPFAPPFRDLVPVVYFGPSEFQVEDYKGNMSSWQDFGKFVYALKQGKDVLPDAVKQKVHALADGIPDTRGKIAVLYEYLQKNTRYISIQLGIGGWQPFDAKYVAGKAYGDCKALTNYMFSLLKEAGITSYYTLVKAGASAADMRTDFPSSQFNHVILCVPQQKDTTWLECTSQTYPSGYLGSSACNRYALLVNEEGGKLVRTTSYGIRENLQIRKIAATLKDDGTLELKASTRYEGLQQDNIHGVINHLSKDKVKEYLHEQLDLATYEINKFDYKEEKKALPAVVEELDITVSNYANITGKRLFIAPNIMTRMHRKLSEDPDRKYEIKLGVAYHDIDSVIIELPGGFGPESIPQEVSISNQFGKYNSSVKLTGNKLSYYRSIEFFGGKFPAQDYTDLVKFFTTIYKADRNKVVLVKADQPLKGF